MLTGSSPVGVNAAVAVILTLRRAAFSRRRPRRVKRMVTTGRDLPLRVLLTVPVAIRVFVPRLPAVIHLTTSQPALGCVKG